MNEILPIAGGFLVGGLLCDLRPRTRWGVGAILTVSIGILATCITGELLASWHFLYVDVLIVVVSGLGGFVVTAGCRVLAPERTVVFRSNSILNSSSLARDSSSS